MTRRFLNPNALLGQDPSLEEVTKSLSDIFTLLDAFVVTVTADYTTLGRPLEKIICNNTSPLTVTLGNHQNLDKVQVIRANTGSVDISGDINGTSSQSIASQWDSMTVEYFEDLDEWIIHG